MNVGEIMDRLTMGLLDGSITKETKVLVDGNQTDGLIVDEEGVIICTAEPVYEGLNWVS